jgi:FkbM family methyltransferase
MESFDMSLSTFGLVTCPLGTFLTNRLDWGLYLNANYDAGEPEEINVLKSLLHNRRTYFGDGVVAIDCGANIGLYTVTWAKAMAGWGRVIAFEAQEWVFYTLAGNLAINNCLNASASLAAVSATDGIMHIPYLDPSKPSRFGSFELKKLEKTEDVGQPIDYERTKPVTMVRLDTLDLDRVDLIKIDVEGMELDVLAGATGTILRCKPILFIETIKGNIKELRFYLSNVGYKVFDFPYDLLAIHPDDKSINHVRMVP